MITVIKKQITKIKNRDPLTKRIIACAYVEIKALTGNIPAVFELQVLSYLKASGYKVGLLINFGNKSCQIRRLMV